MGPSVLYIQLPYSEHTIAGENPKCVTKSPKHTCNSNFLFQCSVYCVHTTPGTIQGLSSFPHCTWPPKSQVMKVTFSLPLGAYSQSPSSTPLVASGCWLWLRATSLNLTMFPCFVRLSRREVLPLLSSPTTISLIRRYVCDLGKDTHTHTHTHTS